MSERALRRARRAAFWDYSSETPAKCAKKVQFSSVLLSVPCKCIASSHYVAVLFQKDMDDQLSDPSGTYTDMNGVDEGAMNDTETATNSSKDNLNDKRQDSSLAETIPLGSSESHEQDSGESSKGVGQMAEIEEEDDLITRPVDTKSFCLVCQSVEELRQLCARFEGAKGSEGIFNAVIDRARFSDLNHNCKPVGQLYTNLDDLLTELSSWEAKLQSLLIKSIEQLKKSHDSYIEPEKEDEVRVNANSIYSFQLSLNLMRPSV